MKNKLSASCRKILAHSAILLSLLSLLPAQGQTPNGRTEIPVTTENKSMEITGLKAGQIENLEGGGIKAAIRNDRDKRFGVGIRFALPEPVNANRITFEMRQTDTTMIFVTAVLSNGKKLKTGVPGLGADLSTYDVDLAYLASQAKMDLDSPVSSIAISFRVPPQSGDQSIELKKVTLE